jgi:hypothetical protein
VRTDRDQSSRVCKARRNIFATNRATRSACCSRSDGERIDDDATAILADGHAKLIEQQFEFFGDAKHDYVVPSLRSFVTLTANLPGYDPTKALVEVAFATRTICRSTEGAIVRLEPPEPADIVYLSNGIPDPARTYAADGEIAVIYNIDPKSSEKEMIRLSWATAVGDGGPSMACGQIRYPVAAPSEPGILYDEVFPLESGETITHVVIVIDR